MQQPNRQQPTLHWVPIDFEAYSVIRRLEYQDWFHPYSCLLCDSDQCWHCQQLIDADNQAWRDQMAAIKAQEQDRIWQDSDSDFSDSSSTQSEPD